MAIISVCLVAIFILYLIPETKKHQKKKRDFESLVKKTHQKMETYIQESSKESLSLTDVEKKEEVLRIWVELLFEPQDEKEVREWTDQICQKCKSMFLDYGIEKDIAVWAYRPMGNKEKPEILGRTFYSPHIGEFDFKTSKELRPPKIKIFQK